jgi:hypothetical protein
MKQQLLFVGSLLLIGIQFIRAQNSSSAYLARFSTGASGSSENVTLNKKTYLVQQSIGQSSVIGIFYGKDYSVRQGFIQPNVLAKIIDLGIPLRLEALVYPNPFAERVTIKFSELITGKVAVAVFDLLGRQVFSKSFTTSKNLKLDLSVLPAAGYLLKVTGNNKQFIKKLVKK